MVPGSIGLLEGALAKKCCTDLPGDPSASPKKTEGCRNGILTILRLLFLLEL